MKRILLPLVALAIVSVQTARAQTAPADDSKPAASNVAGQPYPRIDSQLRAAFRINAPSAQQVYVQVDKRYDMAKGADGAWTVTTTPLVPGFHYYTLYVDGAVTTDPGSETYFGMSRNASGLEVPEQGVDFYDAKDVPHGEVRARYYPSKTTGATRRAFVYVPPGYDKDNMTRYPVLYLQHGMGEDERGWTVQGRANFILDNLIAAGKAKPMIVVMDNGDIPMMGMGGGRGRGAGGAPGTAPGGGGAPGGGNPPAGRGGGVPGGFGNSFQPILINEIIPLIDATYRTIPDRDHRAMAGLSMGGTQTFQITQGNLDKFAYIGAFSAPFGYPDTATGYNGLLAKPDEFAKQVKVFFISMGSVERTGGGTRNFHNALDAAHITHTYYESPGTDHEWQTWRKSLFNFAPLLFKD